MYKPELNEHIERINFLTGYVVNESPKYKAIMDGSSYDSLPEGWNIKEAEGDNEPKDSSSPADPAAAPVGQASSSPAPASPSSATPTPVDNNSPVPASSAPVSPDPAVSSAPAPVQEPISAVPQPIQPPQPAVPSADELQKKVLEYQLEAMKNMSRKIEELEGMVGGLNSQLATFSAEVEKVKEPTDVEKFDERKLDSHPYYYNLNDLWNNNTFQGRMDTMNSKGIVRTKDGGYQADFDQLPKLSQYEVRDSFDAV